MKHLPTKKFLLSLCLFVSVATMATTAQATVVIPTTGQSGFFHFSPLGPVTSIDGVPGNDFSLTVAGPSVVNIFLDDGFIIGDEFSLSLDGSPLVPTASNPGGPSLYFADYLNVFLSPGAHTFDLFLTAACCGGGKAFYEFSPVSPVSSAVPEPSTILLLGSGLVGLIGYRMKKARA